MQSDGSEPARLTHGEQERYPAFTPDGQWIVYLSSQLGEPDGTLWKIPLAGGAPVRVAERANRFSLAPDGQSIAYLRTSGLAQRRIVLLSLAGASPERILDLPPEQTVHRYLRWAADSRALYCVFEQQGFSDIWRQPLDGSPPQRITHLNVEGGLLFDFSPDGKRLVLSRQLWTSDLLLLSNFR
jgi:Tol biopolymer transport system component